VRTFSLNQNQSRTLTLDFQVDSIVPCSTVLTNNAAVIADTLTSTSAPLPKLPSFARHHLHRLRPLLALTNPDPQIVYVTQSSGSSSGSGSSGIQHYPKPKGQVKGARTTYFTAAQQREYGFIPPVKRRWQSIWYLKQRLIETDSARERLLENRARSDKYTIPKLHSAMLCT